MAGWLHPCCRDPRLQWRDRCGIAPHSVFPGTGSSVPCIACAAAAVNGRGRPARSAQPAREQFDGEGLTSDNRRFRGSAAGATATR